MVGGAACRTFRTISHVAAGRVVPSPVHLALHRVYLDQCHFGSIYKKPTILVGTLSVAKLSARLLKRADRIDVFNETDALASDGYPAELCKQLALKILLAAVNHRTVMLRLACAKFGVHTSKPSVAWVVCVRVGGFVSECPYLAHEVC